MIFILVSTLWYRLSVCCVIIVLATGCQTPLREVKLKWLSWADDNNLMTDTHISEQCTYQSTHRYVYAQKHTLTKFTLSNTDKWTCTHVCSLIQMNAQWEIYLLTGTYTMNNSRCSLNKLFYCLLSHTWIWNTFVCAGSHHVIIRAECYPYKDTAWVKSVLILIPFLQIKSQRFYAV